MQFDCIRNLTDLFRLPVNSLLGMEEKNKADRSIKVLYYIGSDT